MFSNLLPIFNFPSKPELLKALELIDLTVSGIIKSPFNLEQLRKTSYPIHSTSSGMVNSPKARFEIILFEFAQSNKQVPFSSFFSTNT
jgi:hypothetical protein